MTITVHRSFFLASLTATSTSLHTPFRKPLLDCIPRGPFVASPTNDRTEPIGGSFVLLEPNLD
jgi:hypothetical protein